MCYMTDYRVDDHQIEAAQLYARERLSDKRHDHTLRVAEAAERLAGAHGLDRRQARLAALLHDSAREMGPEEMLRIALKLGIPVGTFEKENPKILHGPVAAELAGEHLGVTDEHVLDAVRAHTTGVPGMGRLELVVFLADKIEPARDYPGIEGLRELSARDLKEAARVSLKRSISYNEERGKPIHPASRETLEWLGDERPKKRRV